MHVGRLTSCAAIALLFVLISAGRASGRPGPGTTSERATASPISATEIAAVFSHRRYQAGVHAHLRIWAHARNLSVRFFACGPGNGPFDGAPVTKAHVRPWAGSAYPRMVSVRLGRWPSGLYFIHLRAPDGRVGYAPFIIRPRHPSAPTAVFLPTNTWAAYNFRDMDGDGVGDTWYADPDIHRVRLDRPFLPPGMPRYFRVSLRMLHWLYRHQLAADFYADDDFARLQGGGWLARHYRLAVFLGHEEYVTPTEYDDVVAARNHGENLAFLAANNFFYRVTRHKNVLYGRTKWRDLGRPEAALVGVQYVDWYKGIFPNKPYVVRGRRSSPWAFEGTGLRNGDRFGRFGIEVDARARSSPANIKLLAQARDIFGPGKSAEMTYYRTGNGAKVFAAGALNFAGHAGQRVVSRLISNVLAKLEHG